jgi:hypothetical protein
MTIRFVRLFVCITILSFLAERAAAVVLFSDNFNTNTSANWTLNKAPSATDPNKQKAEFAFDYSTFGIPAAPTSSDTLGLRLRGNVPLDGSGNETTTRPAGTLSGLSVSPTSQNFGTNYQVTFYAWSNFAGAPNANGLADNANSEGGTSNVLFALGTSGTVPLVVGNTSAVTDSTIDGIAFATTGDGGIVNDYRAYPKTNTIGPTSMLAAGAYGNTAAFYTAKFPAVAAPAAQAGIASSTYTEPSGNNPMAGTTQAGAFGFAWHKVVMMKNNNSVTWSVDDNLFATVDTSAITLGGNNIALGVSDVNGTTARYPNLVFTIFDNLTVSTIGTAGDFNNDTKVDAGDYAVWRKNDSTLAALPNDNGVGTQAARFNLWRQNFGSGVSGSGTTLGATVIPEPASIVLLAVCGAACVCSGRRRLPVI